MNLREAKDHAEAILRNADDNIPRKVAEHARSILAAVDASPEREYTIVEIADALCSVLQIDPEQPYIRGELRVAFNGHHIAPKQVQSGFAYMVPMAILLANSLGLNVKRAPGFETHYPLIPYIEPEAIINFEYVPVTFADTPAGKAEKADAQS